LAVSRSKHQTVFVIRQTVSVKLAAVRWHCFTTTIRTPMTLVVYWRHVPKASWLINTK